MEFFSPFVEVHFPVEPKGRPLHGCGEIELRVQSAFNVSTSFTPTTTPSHDNEGGGK